MYKMVQNLSHIISSVKELHVYKIGDQNLTILCYADGARLLGNSGDNLKRTTKTQIRGDIQGTVTV